MTVQSLAANDDIQVTPPETVSNHRQNGEQPGGVRFTRIFRNDGFLERAARLPER
jgi:hypothetical protein